MKLDLVKRRSFPPLIAGVLAEIGYAAAIGAIGILVCAAILFASGVL